jgi:hypothetical protein
MGIRLKKSFGTAIKFYDKKEIFASILLYIVIILEYKHLPSFGNIKEIFLQVLSFLSV